MNAWPIASVAMMLLWCNISGRRDDVTIDHARMACFTARGATVMWRSQHPHDGCPTVAQLKQDKLLGDAFNEKDPWGNAINLSCEEDDIVCETDGPDQKHGTPDDVRVPSTHSP
jgi:hypothetical protein